MVKADPKSRFDHTKNQNFYAEKHAEINDFSVFLVRVVRLERTVSWSQTRRDTSFAIPGYLAFRFLNIFLSVVIPVVKGDFEVLFTRREKPANARVSTDFTVSVSVCPDSGTPFPNQARYQLRYTRKFMKLFYLVVFPNYRHR